MQHCGKSVDYSLGVSCINKCGKSWRESLKQFLHSLRESPGNSLAGCLKTVFGRFWKVSLEEF